MKAYVFTDKSLERYAGQFVWLSIDTENGTNGAFLAKYPIHVWPTLLVIDPKKEAVSLKYAGGATVPQLRKLLDDGRLVFEGTRCAADQATPRAVGRVPGRGGGDGEGAGAARRLRLASPHRVPGSEDAGEGHRDARAVGARLSEGLQPAVAAVRRVQGDGQVRRGPRRDRARA